MYFIKKALTIIFLLGCQYFSAQNSDIREQILIDEGWHFAFGHPYDTQKDFNHATSYFSYLAKAGNGDGPAAEKFDDRAWRLLNLPHDWAVEQPFSENGSFSHGFKKSGKDFPERSIGWYRKKVVLSESDTGRIITIKFDGVFRNSKVWFNGFYLGNEASGYNGFEYDVTAYAKFGEENTIAIRVDASMEEGWFYEGAGIYRHVYLQKSNPLYIPSNGTYITTDVKNKTAEIKAQTYLTNKGSYSGSVEIVQTLFSPGGLPVLSVTETAKAPGFYKTESFTSKLKVNNPELWDIDTPNLYKLATQIKQNGKVVDVYETTFGIRTIKFDAEKGFFLNGRPVKLKGTNNHQDHAGVGTALPDGLHYFRIRKLKQMGANAYRCSHNPPAPELLDACDRLGMLVIDETRLMGINEMHLSNLKYMIDRDRNHPSICCWSVGNEEWQIEGNIIGERITNTMQDFAKTIDATRPVTVGISSGFKSGISSVVEVMGYNYMGNGDIDAHQKNFKTQPGMGTEEGSTFATRGIYFTDDAKHYQSAYDRKPRPGFYSIEEGWKFYAARPYLAGMFVWTGFDYRGEPTPYGWPSVTSYFGMMDMCGFPKDNFYYLKSWWGTDPVLHILPHWTWPGKEGAEIDVWVYSNCDMVELFLNNKSLGKKIMKQNGHLEWKVAYAPGKLKAIGYKNGKMQLEQICETTGKAQTIKMQPDKSIDVKDSDIAVVTVEVTDKNGLHVPVADNEITFTITGGGKIIGVGNGNPTSLEKDVFLEDIQLVPLNNLKEQELKEKDIPESLPLLDSKSWKTAFENRDYKNLAPAYAYKATFVIDSLAQNSSVTFYYQKIGVNEVVFINGKKIMPTAYDKEKYILEPHVLTQGSNTLYIIANPLKKVNDWDVVNDNPGIIQIITPPEPVKRKLFNGYAQLIIKKNKEDKDIFITAQSEGLTAGHLKIVTP